MEDKAALHILAVNQKQIESMLAILDFHSKHGLRADLAELMEDQRHFLSIPPEAHLEPPSYLIANQFIQRLWKREEPQAFWKLRCEAADACPAIDVVPKQMSLVADKTVTFCDSKDSAGGFAHFHLGEVWHALQPVGLQHHRADQGH